jgi:hypothetical protein
MNAAFLGLFCFLVNVPMGIWRVRVRRFSAAWFVSIHIAVPLIIIIRIFSGISYFYIPLFIALAVLGQFAGGRLGKYFSDKAGETEYE